MTWFVLEQKIVEILSAYNIAYVIAINWWRDARDEVLKRERTEKLEDMTSGDKHTQMNNESFKAYILVSEQYKKWPDLSSKSILSTQNMDRMNGTINFDVENFTNSLSTTWKVVNGGKGGQRFHRKIMSFIRWHLSLPATLQVYVILFALRIQLLASSRTLRKHSVSATAQQIYLLLFHWSM